MVKPEQSSVAMGQVGLCAATPQTDSLSPLNTEEGSSNFSASIISEIEDNLSLLLANGENLNPSDLLLKLRCLVNENLELKDTIAQNNLALRQQLNLLVQWNQQVEQQQCEYRQALNDSNKRVAALQQENTLFRTTLLQSRDSNSSINKFQELDKTIQNLNESLLESDSNLQKTLEEKEQHLSERTKLEGEIALLKCDLTTIRSEFERLYSQKQEYISTVNNLRQQLQEKGSSRGIESYQVSGDVGYDVQQLANDLEREKNTSTSLLLELQEAKKKVDILESQLKMFKDDSTKSKVIDGVESPTSPDRKVEDNEKRRLKDEAAMLREEVDTLEAALESERKRASDERLTLSRMHSETARLKKDLQESRERSERSEYNDQYYLAKIKSVQEQHDEATAKLLSYEELLGSKNDEIARLKKELGHIKAQLIELKSEGDTIAVLRAQVEVYQCDFRAEREAREALATDREKLRDEMRHLQTRNTQLMDELETYQRRHFNQGPDRNSRAGSEEPYLVNSKDPSSLNPDSIWERLSMSPDKKDEEVKKKDDTVELDENLLYCPKCNKTFAELRPLEEHVNRCLDED